MVRILWINGTFGVGKTATAYELHRRIKNSFVFDPEEVGFYISKNIPKSTGESDFQKHPMWRKFNHEMLDHIASKYKGLIIVPMTIVNKAYMDEILADLPVCPEAIKCFTLMGSKKTITKRLRIRGEIRGGWGLDHLVPNMDLLSQPCFEPYIDTEELSINEVVEKIADLSKIELDEKRLPFIKFRLERLRVQFKHMRV